MLTILIVEDAAYERKQFIQALSAIENVHILEAQNGEEALQLMKSQRVELFLLDVQMPGMDGFELARCIRNQPGYGITPILFVTGYSKNPLDAFRQYHCYDYITKPFVMDDLVKKVEDLLEAMRLEREKTHVTQKLVPLETVSGMAFFQVADIRFAEMMKGNCFICTDQEKVRLQEMTLGRLIEEIGEDFFVQCHRSFAVNVRYIFKIVQLNYRQWQIELKGSGERIELTKHFKQQVDQAIQRQLEKQKGG